MTFNETEAEMKNSFFVENCKNINLSIVKSKIKSIIISKCDKLKILVKDCVSGVEIMGAKNVELKVLGWCPSISVDSSQDVRIILHGENKNTDILSCKTSQLIVTHTLTNEDLYVIILLILERSHNRRPVYHSLEPNQQQVRNQDLWSVLVIAMRIILG